MRFKDQSVIVTGAGGGIGYATACLMAREGARVAINDVDVGKVDAAVARIRAEGGDAIPLVADAGMETDVRNAVEHVMSEWGRIDILVNNAGIMVRKSAHEATLQEWRQGLAVNLDGPFVWAQAVATKSMIPRRQGVIVNVASIAGLVAIPNAAAYVASKHGLVGLTKAQALDWGSYNIRVNAVCPGMTWTDISKEGRERNPKYFQEREKRIPLGRAATRRASGGDRLFGFFTIFGSPRFDYERRWRESFHAFWRHFGGLVDSPSPNSQSIIYYVSQLARGKSRHNRARRGKNACKRSSMITS